MCSPLPLTFYCRWDTLLKSRGLVGSRLRPTSLLFKIGIQFRRPKPDVATDAEKRHIAIDRLNLCVHPRARYVEDFRGFFDGDESFGGDGHDSVSCKGSPSNFTSCATVRQRVQFSSVGAKGFLSW